MSFRLSSMLVICFVFFIHCALGAMSQGDSSRMNVDQPSKLRSANTTFEERQRYFYALTQRAEKENEPNFNDIDLGEKLDYGEGSTTLADVPQYKRDRDLFVAVDNNDYLMLEQLLMYKADPWGLDRSDYLALHYAASWNRYECLKVLLKFIKPQEIGDYLSAPGGEHDETAVMLAAKANCKEAIEILLSVIPEQRRFKYVVGHKSKLYESALSYAVRCRHLEAIRSLIFMLPDDYRYLCLTAPHSDEMNVLHIAVSLGYADIIEIFLDLLPSEQRIRFINARTGGGDTALHIAASKGQIDIVSFLLDRGAKPGLEDLCGQTPAEVALTEEIRDIINKFLTSV